MALSKQERKEMARKAMESVGARSQMALVLPGLTLTRRS